MRLDICASSLAFSRATHCAAALYRKAGSVEEGIKRRAILIDGVFHDEIIMARFRN